jgi:hypothetical protein
MRLLRPLLLVAALLAAPAARAEEAVDLALVLAIDVSRSIDDEEFELQRAGYAAAFRDPRILEAIHSGPAGAIAVTCFQWSGIRQQEQIVPWSRIDDAASAERLAHVLATSQRQVFAGSTSLSGAVDFATELLAKAPPARRRVIDVSGDGSNNNGRFPTYARDDAVAAGITINGLAILNEEPGLDLYYEQRLIGGLGAFVIPARDFEDFGRAILAKLIREIATAAAE